MKHKKGIPLVAIKPLANSQVKSQGTKTAASHGANNNTSNHNRNNTTTTGKKHFVPSIYELQLEDLENDVLIEKLSLMFILLFLID